MTDDELLATPAGFAMEVLGLDLYPWQADVLSALEESPSSRVKVTLATPNGAGKSERVVATAFLWWLSMFPQGKVVVTTKSGLQLDTQVQPAIKAHQAKFPGWKFIDRQVSTPTGGLGLMFTTDDAGRAEGHHPVGSIHDGPVLIIVDEAKSVEQEIFEALDRCTWSALLYVSSPGSMHGRFFESHNDEDMGFTRVRAGLADCPHIPKEKVEYIQATYKNNPSFIRSVLHGEFMLADGETKFDREGLEYLQELCKEGYGQGKVGRLEPSGPTGRVVFLPDPDGWLWMDREGDRVPGLSYMISCDPNKCEQAEGTSDRDNTACVVLRQAYLSADGEEKRELFAACLHDQRSTRNKGVKWDSDTVARRMKLVSDYYGGSMAVIEENNFGSALIKCCQNECIPLWRRTKTDDVNPNKQLKIVGYSSSAKTREWWVQKCAAAIRDQALICRYEPAVSEFATFITLANGRAEALAGKHDDWVAATGIGLVVQCYSPMPRVQRMHGLYGSHAYNSDESPKGSGALG